MRETHYHMTRNSVRALECVIIFQNWRSHKNFDPPHIFVHPPVYTDGAAASKCLSREWRHGVVNDKKVWVAATGVHTNTVEAANSSLKKELF